MEHEQKNNLSTVFSIVAVIALALTWAISTIFTITLVKSFAAVIIVAFIAMVFLFSTGIA